MEFKVQDPLNVKITSVRLSMRCTVCGNTWGVTLDELLQIPYRGDKCIACWKRKTTQIMESFEGKEGGINHVQL